jgi:hypothetical protein
MPKRRVKQVSWEVMSESMKVTAAMERRIWKGVVASSERVLQEFSYLAEDDKIFYELPSAALAAYNTKRYSEAADLAQRSILAAESFKDDWNYSNALHIGHTVLGLLALRDEKIPKALAELHASAKVAGSPQLGSFGPSMRLARGLLELGEAEQVLIFLEACSKFWKMGDSWISVWQKKIRRGDIPNFYTQIYW